MKELAQWAQGPLPFISEKAKRTVRMAFADFFGVALAAVDEPLYDKITRYIGHTATGTVPLPATSITAGAQQAAIALGALGHALDYDDISAVMIGHPSVVLIPSLMAIASEYELSGQDVFQGYIAGYEVIGRLSKGAAEPQYQRGLHTTATIGIFGAVIGSARLLGLTHQQTEHALGIACSLASGIRANFGTMTKPLHAGWAAGNAVFAVELARDGFDSSQDALHSWLSVFDARFQESEPGDDLYIEQGLIIKPYPSCGCSTRAIDCAFELRKGPEFDMSEIESIVCSISPLTDKVLRYAKPATGMEAKFSLEYCVAQTLISGPLRSEHFEDDFVQDQAQTRKLMEKVVRVIPEDMRQGVAFGKEYIKVELYLADGKTLLSKISEPKGYPENPLTQQEFRQKFDDCVSRSLLPSRRDALFDQFITIDQVDNISSLMEEMTDGVREFRNRGEAPMVNR